MVIKNMRVNFKSEKDFKNFKIKNRVFKSFVSFILVICMLISSVPTSINAADTNRYNFRWVFGSSMSRDLYIENVDDTNTDIYLAWNNTERRNYTFDFVVPDSNPTTWYNSEHGTTFDDGDDAICKHVITLTCSNDSDISYTLEHKVLILGDFDSFDEGSYDATKVCLRSVKQYDAARREMLPVMSTAAGEDAVKILYEMANINNKGGCVYSIEDTEYRFQYIIENENTINFHLNISNISGLRRDSYIYRFNLSSGSTKADPIEICRNINFSTRATRWKINSNTSTDVDAELVDTTNTVILSNIEDDPTNDTLNTLYKDNTSKPGIEFSINSFKKYNEDTNKFESIDPSSLDSTITLNIRKPSAGNNQQSESVHAIPETNLSKLRYNSSDGMYYLDIIGCDDGPVHDGTIFNKHGRNYTVIPHLEESNVYNVDLSIKLNGEITVKRQNAYTYTNFEVVRKNINETYLKFTPYKIAGTYQIYVGDQFGNLINPGLLMAETEVNGDNTNEVYVPLDIVPALSGIPEKFIQMDFKINGVSMQGSEVLFYNRNLDKFVAVDVPSNVKVQDVTVIRSGNQNSDIDVAQFKLLFDVPQGLTDNKILLDGEKIWYEVYLNTRADTANANEQYQIADIIEIKREGGKLVTTTKSRTWQKPDDKREIDNDTIVADISLKPIQNTGAVTYENGGFYGYYKQDGINTADDEVNRLQTYRVDNYVMPTNSNGEPDPNGAKNRYYLPSTNRIPTGGANYYITLRGYYQIKNGTEYVIRRSDYSVPVNVVLTDTQEIIPIPGEVDFNKLSGIDTIKQQSLSIKEIDWNNYFNTMLNPVLVNKSSVKVEYEIYFTQNQDMLNTAISCDEITGKNGNKRELTNIPGDIDIKKVLINDSSLSNEYHKITVGNGSSYDININNLRDEKKNVFQIVTNNPKIYFDGLDSNQNYYYGIRAKLSFTDRHGDKVTRFSEISKVYYTMTGNNPINPYDSEKVPPTPTSFDVYGEVDDTSVTVEWKAPDMTLEPEIQYGYELVRVADERIKGDNKSNSLSLKNLADKNYNEFQAFRYLDESNGVIPTSNSFYHYIASEDTFINDINQIDVARFSYDIDNNYFRVLDSGLKPNRIYFYYVRRIKISDKGTDQEVTLYSEWAELTTTTIPVKGIINLREVDSVTAKTAFGIDVFDPYYERIIAFEAPTGAGMVPGKFKDKNKATPENIRFSINYKDSLDTEYEEAQVLLCSVGNNTGDTATYVYKLQNLESGTRYNIRVAVVDLTIKDKYGENPISAYSDPISVRTEFNQEDYDKRDKYKEYETYYDYVLDNLINEKVFILDNDETNYAIKYKEDKLQGDLGKTTETTYLLPTTNARNFTYYITGNNIKEMMRLKKGLRIEKDGVTITIPYNFLNSEYQKVYGDRVKNVDNTKDKVEDFYLKIWVGFSDGQSYINNARTSGKQVQIAMKFIEQNTMNMDIDVVVEDKIRDYVESNKESFFEKVEQELEGQINDAQFLKYVDDEIGSIRTRIQKMASEELADYEMETFTLNDFYNEINIKYKTNDISSKIYTKANSSLTWTGVSTSNMGGYASGYISEPGLVILTTMANQQIQYSSDSESNAYFTRYKYELDDIFIRDGVYSSKTDKVSQELFRDIAFQIMQKNGDNIFNLARAKQQLDSMFVFYNDPLTRQECLYGVLQLFDEFSQINLNKVIIDNAGQANASNYLSYYRQSILAGYQLGVVSYSDIQNPKGYMTVDELLDLIYRVLG